MRFLPGGGAAVRISAGPDGSPWVVNSAGAIFHWVDNTWRQLPGEARDIGVGADGSVWIIGTDERIFKWAGNDWTPVPGAAVAISVAPDGSPWVINSQGMIFRWVDDTFQQIPGGGTDIAIGGNGRVWIIGGDGDGLYYFLEGNRSRRSPQDVAIRETGFTRVPTIDITDALRISLGPDGRPWVVTKSGAIYGMVHRSFQRLPGEAQDIGVGGDGSVWVIGAAQKPGPLRGIAVEIRQPDQGQKLEPIVTGIGGPFAAPQPDRPVPGAKQEMLICRGSGDPKDFKIQSLVGSKPGYTKLVIDIGFYLDAEPGDKMEPGSCLFANRNYQQNEANRRGDPSRLIEEVADDTSPTAADDLRNANKYWLFNVYHYVTAKGEHYFKVSSSRETGPATRID